MGKHLSIEDRFWGKVQKTRTCWIWIGTRMKNGYGIFSINGKNFLAHRISRELAGVPVPSDLDTRHTCHNRACVRPSHLLHGTRAENMRDMVLAGRHHPCRGESHGSAKLTKVQVLEIRSRIGDGERPVDLAFEFGVNDRTVSNIKHRKTWKHV